MNETLSETLLTAINAPQCSILTGMIIGIAFFLRFLIIAWLFMIVTKVIDKLAINPLIEWIKNKIYKRRK